MVEKRSPAIAKGSYEPRQAAWLTVASWNGRLGGKRRLPNLHPLITT
jgi:hypothetical protein